MAKRNNWENDAPEYEVKHAVRVHLHNGPPVDFDNEEDAIKFVREARHNPQSRNSHLFREDEPVQFSQVSHVVEKEDNEDEPEYSHPDDEDDE